MYTTMLGVYLMLSVAGDNTITIQAIGVVPVIPIRVVSLVPRPQRQMAQATLSTCPMEGFYPPPQFTVVAGRSCSHLCTLVLVRETPPTGTGTISAWTAAGPSRTRWARSR